MSKNYCCMTFSKIKTTKQMISSYKHNMRIFDVANADPARKHLNHEIIGSQGDYVQIYEDTLAELHMHGGQKKAVRSDAIKELEILLTYTRDANSSINQKDWEKANLEWLNETFNPPGRMATCKDPVTGEEHSFQTNNVKAVITHNDESNPHIHAVVVPVNAKGNISASDYIHGRDKLIHMQTTYAEKMKQFGLERGETGSLLSHQQISRYHNEIKNVVEAKMPDPELDESIDEYRYRCDDVLINVLANKKKDMDQAMQRLNQEHARAIKAEGLLEKVTLEYETRLREMNESMQKMQTSHEQELQEAITKSSERESKITHQLNKLARATGYDEVNESMLREVRHGYNKAKHLESAIQNTEDRDNADFVQDMIDQLLSEEKVRRRKEKELQQTKEGCEHQNS